MNANSTTKLANPQGSKTETKHTPTISEETLPLSIHEPAEGQGWREIETSNGFHVATCYATDSQDRAAFIVRACNEHTALCAVAEAAELARQLLCSLSFKIDPSIHHQEHDDIANIDRIVKTKLANLAAIRNQK